MIWLVLYFVAASITAAAMIRIIARDPGRLDVAVCLTAGLLWPISLPLIGVAAYIAYFRLRHG